MYSYEQGFYITLPSQSSGDVFPENNPSEYTVRLPHWIQLKGEWEIGLHSISYTPWNIIQPLDEPISFMNGGKKGKGGKMRKHSRGEMLGLRVCKSIANPVTNSKFATICHICTRANS